MSSSHISSSTRVTRLIILQRHGGLIIWRHVPTLCVPLSEVLGSRRHHGILPQASSLLHHHNQGDEADHNCHDDDVPDDGTIVACEPEAEDAVDQPDGDGQRTKNAVRLLWDSGAGNLRPAKVEMAQQAGSPGD